LGVQIKHKVAEQIASHPLFVLIVTDVPETGNPVDGFDTQCQLDSHTLCFCRSGLPMLNLAFVLFDTPHIFFTSDVPFSIEMNGRIYPAPTHGNGCPLLRL
jgi:hypothetical protein